MRHALAPAIGASMTFSSAVMCGNRLNRWNTMPMSRRCAATSLSRSSCSLSPLLPVADQLAVDREPAGVDLLQVVDAAQERRLARAGRADAGRSPRRGATSRSMPLSTSTAPKDLCTSSARTIGRSASGAVRCCVDGRSMRASHRCRAGALGRAAARVSPARRTRGRTAAPGSTGRPSAGWTAPGTRGSSATASGMIWNVRLPIARELEDSSVVTGTAISQRGVLEHRDRLVAGRRDDHPHRLRQHDPAQRLRRGSCPARCAASVWPWSTDWMPARTISAM